MSRSKYPVLVGMLLVVLAFNLSLIVTWRHLEDDWRDPSDLVGQLLLIAAVIICIKYWSKVSWLLQFVRFCCAFFFISVVWNWVYLNKIAFAERRYKMTKLVKIGKKCSGLEEFTWADSLTEWWRTTFTFQDDPCQKYYEALHVDSFWLVSPIKALSFTMVTLFTDSLKPIGEGIGGFIHALLKDLPWMWNMIVFSAAFCMVLVFMYQVVQGAFRYGIRALFCVPQHHPQENGNKGQSETNPAEKESQSKDEFGRDVGALKSDPPERQPSQTADQEQQPSAEDRSPSETETVGSSAK